MKNIKLAQLIVALWCGWVIVQPPYVGTQITADGQYKVDTTRPIHEWDVATFGSRIAFFDTVKECEEQAKVIVMRKSSCAPADWFRPHRWWQFWK